MRGIRINSDRNWGYKAAGILALIWMCVIFAFSAQDKQESSNVSEGVSYELVSSTGFLFHLHLDEEQIREVAAMIESTVRKAAHMTEYAVLAVLLYLWLDGWQWKLWQRAVLAALLSGLYAATDEFHQLFVEGRAGSAGDVLIDTSGAVIGVMLAVCCGFLVRRRRQKQKCTKGMCGNGE